MEETLGSKLRELRVAKGMTQSALGRDLVTASMISQIESNRVVPTQRLLEQLLERLDADRDEFRSLLKANENLQRYREAKTLIERGDLHRARELLLQVAEDVPAQVRTDKVYAELGECCLKLELTDEAIRMYETALAFTLEHGDISTSVHYYYQLGHVERGRRRLQAAAMFWRRGSELLARYPKLRMPVSVKLENNLARVYYISRQYNKALIHYQRACTAAQAYDQVRDLAVIHHGLANVLVEMNRFDEAREHTQRALSLYESVSHSRGVHQCLINQAVILRREGLHEAAITHLQRCQNRRALRQDPPRYTKLQIELARNHLALGDREAAMQLLDAVHHETVREPELAQEVHWVRAQCLMAMKRVEEAATTLEAALPLTDTVEDPLAKLRVWRQLSKLYRELDKPGKALSAELAAVQILRRRCPSPRIFRETVG
ncbi:helix-turn-helix domain-containing protein [Alicyclobacillus shizuokensis]|uniref:helix-turn-helix domain-containing protein n=1 Tax=Alicyclobacillus shizuokensis TaxID=392014 RepID=UPI000836F9C3|nr:helix-turn-helix domain-containing protein [Alicyclobacillus shizuokensis]MCL6625531.1 tetratricopeptide repeat protein [Alicyclobacillus shizuokensis]